MKLCSFICLTWTWCLASGLQVGKQYTYDVTVMVGAGTMDYAPHASGWTNHFRLKLQKPSKNVLNGEISGWEAAETVGPVDPKNIRPDALPMKAIPEAGPYQFTMDTENGLFKSVRIGGSDSVQSLNVVKALVAHLQVNMAEIKAGKASFKSKEHTIHGECEVSYTVTPNAIYKTMSHAKDCPNRPVRRVDGIRGFYCDSREDPTSGIVSTTNTMYEYEKVGSGIKVTGIRHSGAVVSQMFGSDGFSQIVLVNTTVSLIDEVSSPGGIAGSGSSIDSLTYEFSDWHQWDHDRNLKAIEPITSSGMYQAKPLSRTKGELLTGLEKLLEVLDHHDNDEATVGAAHKWGMENLRPIMWGMDYNTLMATHDQLYPDKSEAGIFKSNVFAELLGSTGTSASALVVKAIIEGKKYDNCRDAARILISVPYHILRPNKGLVTEYESLLNLNTDCEYVKRAAPLVFGHLVKMTCTLVKENGKGHMESSRCFKDIGKKWVGDFWSKYKSAGDRNMKSVYMGALSNMQFGGQDKVLQPLIEGKTGDSDEMRVYAIWAAFAGNMVHNKLMDVYFPVFADSSNHHEVRIHALMALLSKHPSTTDMARVIGVLRMEKDYEVVNFAKAQIEKMASSIDPCDKKSSVVAGFFLKYLKQFDQYSVDWGFGVSKTYARQFVKKEYGYAGTVNFVTIGSHDSTTPISVGMSLSTTLHNDYKANNMFISFRVEGLAKALVRKFKTIDPSTWKLDDLSNILKNEMNIRERPDQPVRVGYLVMLKGTIAFQGSFDDQDASQGGKLQDFLADMKSVGKNINHQRLLNAVQVMVEQPTDFGVPAVYSNSLSGLFSVKASGEMKQRRGMFVLEGNYDLHLFIHAQTKMGVESPIAAYGIGQDRAYHIHVPRHLIAGVNPAKRSISLSISRPERNHPAMMMMHSQTMVGKVVKGDVKDMKLVSLGQPKSRTIRDNDSSKWGYHFKGEYFDCEADVARKATITKLLGAMAPYNKNPKTPATSITMGLRQIISFYLLYPKAEKCGMYFKWSQSSQNPVRKIEIQVTGKSVPNGERMFLRGKKMTVSATMKAVGDNTRAYKLNLLRETKPGDLIIRTKLEVIRAATPALGIDAYKICMTYGAQYPKFGKEMYDLDMNKDLTMTGRAKIEYGPGKNGCGNPEGSLDAKFAYSTTAEARESLKEKPFFKECMKLKDSPEWKGRSALPMKMPCLQSVWYGSQARKYSYDIKLNKISDRARTIITTVKSIAKVAAGPLFGVDASGIKVDEIGNFVKADIVVKDDDTAADINLKTASGERSIKDYALRMSGWSKRLRSLLFSNPAERLFGMGVIKACTATRASVATMDAFSFKYALPKCWTLVSGHCSASPSYAVFARQTGGKMSVKAYIGGHSVEFDGSSIKVNGSPVSIPGDRDFLHKQGREEIFRITKWGSTYNVYSYLKVWIMFDGNFVTTIPAPSVRGQHCGLCGNYNRNKWDEMTGKDGHTVMTSVDAFVNEYKWKC